MVRVQNPLTSLADDVAATKRIIDAQDGPVLLVGHSYDGAVITEASNNAKVAALVYVAAFLRTLGSPPEASASLMGQPQAWANSAPSRTAFLFGPEGVLEDFAPDLAMSERTTLVATQAPTQGAALGTPITRPPAHET